MFSSLAGAHPTSYEGGFALMSEMSPGGQETSLIYSPKYWLGAGVVGKRSKDRFNIVTSQVGWLVNRWNLPKAQGNFYLIGGLGYGDLKDPLNGQTSKEGMIYRYGAQADFETRRIYTFLKYTEHRFSDDNSLISDQLSAAIGFAPYLAGFRELNSWVIFKVMSSTQDDDPTYIAMVRFFYKNFLWEIGQDFDGNSQLNYMVRF